MAGPNIPNNLIPNEPTMKDLLDLHGKDLLLKLNTHHIATIKSFDPLKQTASATVNYKKTYFQPNAATGEYTPVLVDYPIIIDAPVVVLGGGNGALTFPIEEGDECLALFNDRDIDNWFQGGGNTAAVATPRLHSFSDALLLVGVRSLANVIPNYSTDAAELRNKLGTVKISVNDDGVTVTTPGLTATFRQQGGMFLENSIGYFNFADNADVDFDTGTVVGQFGHSGKVKFENATGDLIAALYTILTTATAGGYPLLVDASALATLNSFKP